MEQANDDLLLDPSLSKEDLATLPEARLRSLISDAPALSAGLLGGDVGDQADASIVFDNVSQIMAVALLNHDSGMFSAGVKALIAIWKEGDFEALYPVRPPNFEASLWEKLGIDLYALGGLAVAGERWAEMRELAKQSPTGGSSEKSWLRQGQVVSSRSNDEYPEESILRLALARIRRMQPELGEAEARRHLARFDLLADLIIGEEDLRGFYPNAAEFSEDLVEPVVVERLRFDEDPLRSYIFPANTPGMVEALKEYDRMARLQAALGRYRGLHWGWRGFSDARTLIYLAEEHRLEEW